MMELLNVPWKKLTMDFIIKLLKSKDLTTKIFYDLIILIMDKLTKHCHFISFKEIF